MTILTAKDYQKIGLRLQNARKSHKMSLADVAGSIRIKESFINAVENGEWSKLPGKTYAKGYIRQYAELLNISNPLDQQEERVSLQINNSRRKIKSGELVAKAIYSEMRWFHSLSNYWLRVRQNSLGSGVHKRRRSLLAETRIGFTSPVVAMMMIVIFIVLGASAGLWFILAKQDSTHKVQLVREIPNHLQHLLTEVKVQK